MITIPGRIPIRIHPFFWLLIIALGWINSQTVVGTTIWAVVILVSIIIHELGHALTAIYFEQRAEIDLIGFGGQTSRSGKPLKLWQEFLIVLNGPLAGFALCGLAYPFFKNVTFDSIQVREYAVVVTVYVNFFWTLLNLLPIYPLDGGHLVRIILEGTFGIKGVRFALFFSMMLAGVLAGLFFSIGWILMGAILFMFAFDSYRQWSQSRIMTTADGDRGLKEVFQDAEKALQNGDKALAEQKLLEVYTNTDRGVLHYSSAFYLANILSGRGEFEKAYEILEPEKGILDDAGLPLFHQLAWKTGHLDEAASLANQTYQVRPQYQTALINAFVYAGKHDPTAAIGWLKRALSDGLPDPSKMLGHPGFNSLKDEPDFQQLVRKY